MIVHALILSALLNPLCTIVGVLASKGSDDDVALGDRVLVMSLLMYLAVFFIVTVFQLIGVL